MHRIISMKPDNLIILLCAGLLLQCHRKADPTPQPQDQLPAITQNGADTFGCLVNGKPWLPKGFYGVPNFSVTYDPTYNGGNFVVFVYHKVDGTEKYQNLGFGGDQINKPGTYTIDPSITLQAPGLYTAAFQDETKPSPCNDYLFKPTVRLGKFTITRLDNTVAAGTFEFTLIQPGCDTIRVTQGRFDKHL